MKHTLPLRRFEYSVPDTSLKMHLPLVNVNVDFEKGNLSLDGNSGLIVGPAGNLVPALPASDKHRIKVKAAIYPGYNIELSGPFEEEFIFSIEGIIDDGWIIHSCSGLLMLDRTTGRTGDQEWHLTVYLSDDFDNGREIKLRLAMYSISENAELN